MVFKSASLCISCYCLSFKMKMVQSQLTELADILVVLNHTDDLHENMNYYVNETVVNKNKKKTQHLKR